MDIGILASNQPGSRPERTRGLIVRALLGLVLAALVCLAGNNWRVRAGTTRLVSPFGDDLGGTNDCTSPDQPCKTIQNAVTQSNSGDLIELAPGTYTENVTVSQSVTIQGDLITGSTVNGNGTGSVFVVNSGITATLSQVTITNGTAQAATSFDGGGIFNQGILTLFGVTVNGNQAPGTGVGGGICNVGTLTVINSTISGNTSAVSGGGLANQTTNSTATVVNSTINGNSAPQAGGVFNSGAVTLNLTNTIISGSLGGGGDCVNSGGTIGTNDRNLVQDGSCSPAVSGDPLLGPLGNNGGPTFTQALLVGSPAKDAGDDTVLGDPLALTTDQRGSGFPRLACAHVDIGAFEFGGGVPPTVTCPANISTSTDPGQTTATVSFTVTANDQCAGPIPSVCKIGTTVITSPHAFPVGVTTVTCSATNSQSLTGMCSFTVTVTLLNGCIQDDRSGDTLRFNTQTGAYVYTRCSDKFTLSGTGTVRVSGGMITLTDSRPDRRINATFLTGQMTGRATVTLKPGPGLSQTISLNQTNSHATCMCPGGA